MAGIAVRAADTAGASQRTTVYLKQGEQAAWVDTGEAIPENFNAVIKRQLILPINHRVTPYT